MIIKPKRRHIKLIIVIGVILFIICSLALAVILSQRSAAPRNPNKTVSKNAQSSQPASDAKTSTVFDKSQYSTTDPNSMWVVVNKQHPLHPIDYALSDLVTVGGGTVSKKIAPALSTLIADAKASAVNLHVISGYRSYSYQVNLYNSYVTSDGQAKADTYSARPGYSEHQTGLAVDVGGAHGCDMQQCFGLMPEGLWLATNAAKYGFIIRYTTQNQAITGYEAEPWHLRYVGTELAAEMKKQNIDSLETFFTISGGSVYSR